MYRDKFESTQRGAGRWVDGMLEPRTNFRGGQDLGVGEEAEGRVPGLARLGEAVEDLVEGDDEVLEPVSGEDGNPGGGGGGVQTYGTLCPSPVTEKEKHKSTNTLFRSLGKGKVSRQFATMGGGPGEPTHDTLPPGSLFNKQAEAIIGAGSCSLPPSLSLADGPGPPSHCPTPLRKETVGSHFGFVIGMERGGPDESAL